MDVKEIFGEVEKIKDDFISFNRSILKEILRDNKDTEFGRKYGFENITDERTYREAVPVSTYDDYEDYIGRIVRGEENLLTSYDIYSMLTTSGSTKGSKLIPITSEALKRYRNVMDRFLIYHRKKYGGRRLFISFLEADSGKNAGRFDPMLFTAAYYKFNSEQGDFHPEDLVGEKKVNFFSGACDYIYAKLWMALASDDISSLESVYLYDMLVFFHYFEMYYREILSDMEQRRVPNEINLPSDVKDYLENMDFTYDRIRKLKIECEYSFDDIVSRIWPKVNIISGIGSEAFSVEEKSLKKYIGNIPVWHYIYAASESVMAVPVDTDTFNYILYPGSAYYEFRSVDTGEITEIQELEAGKQYELILTTFSGLYRYSLGDVLKVVGFYGRLPIICFMYRSNLILNIAGEKVDMNVLEHAVNRWSRDRNLKLWQYFFYEDYSTIPARYHGVIVFEDDEEYNKITGSEGAVFEEILKKCSRDYEELRALKSIGRIRLEYVDKETFLAIRSSWTGRRGQPKPIHIMRQ